MNQLEKIQYITSELKKMEKDNQKICVYSVETSEKIAEVSKVSKNNIVYSICNEDGPKVVANDWFNISGLMSTFIESENYKLVLVSGLVTEKIKVQYI